MREDEAKSAGRGAQGPTDTVGGHADHSSSRGQEGQEGVAPSRKDRERAMHRDQILEAARNLLGRKAYNEITVQEIAADAEFSVGYIYKIFESKEEIYVTLVKDQWDGLLGIVSREASRTAGFEERLQKVVQGVFGWLDANPAFSANHMHEIHCLAHALPRLARTHAEMEERLQQTAGAFLKGGVEAAVIKGDIEIMMRTLRALIWGFVGEDMLHGVKSRKWTEYTPVVVGVFLRAFAPEGGLR